MSGEEQAATIVAMSEYYNFSAIEAKWQKRWKENNADATDLDAREKYYCLDMFPYPSGQGLHVGHWRGYILSDYFARYWKLRGKEVLHPMGFDSFGLPAENAAIKNNSHPEKFTREAIETFHKQLSSTGATYDWRKTVTTSAPEYYRWTQWLFLQLYKHGFAQKREAQVNWCPEDATVLANEQVVNGRCERCGATITKKNLSQWFFLTTKLAQELLDGLDELDWPDHVKELQRNWIGKSSGASVLFECSAGQIEVFTTRLDTLFGVSALVLAPEHPLLPQLITSEQDKVVAKYCAQAAAKTNIDREQRSAQDKTGVFTGSYATHPLTSAKIPIWIADYVIPGYGTGAVMSVPAHDERDWYFSKKYKLPIKKVIETEESELPTVGMGKTVESGEFSGLSSVEAQKKIADKLESISKGKEAQAWRLRDWLVSRQRYWGAPVPIVYDPDGKPHPVKDEYLPLKLPEDIDFRPRGESPIARSQEYLKKAEALYGKGWRFDSDTLDTFVDSSWYYFRYLSPNDSTAALNKELIKKWLPVDLYIGGIEHATMHLLYARFISRFLAKHGYIDLSVTEPFKKLFNIGMVTLHGAKMSKSKGNVVTADELVEQVGADALRGYVLFLGPMDQEVEWNPRGINGIYRFLVRLNKLSERVKATDKPDTQQSEQFSQYLSTINANIEQFHLNRALAAAMELANLWERAGKIPQRLWRDYIITLAPVFPHLAEELWERSGAKESVFRASWPQVTAIKSVNKLKVLCNQKFVGELEVEDGLAEEEVLALIKKNPALGKKVQNINVTRTIYRAKEVINIIGS